MKNATGAGGGDAAGITETATTTKALRKETEMFYELYGDENIEDVLRNDGSDDTYVFRGEKDPPRHMHHHASCLSSLSLSSKEPTVDQLAVAAASGLTGLHSDHFKRQPWVTRTVEIPVALDLEFSASGNDRSFGECGSTFAYRLESLSVHLHEVPVAAFRASRVIEVMDIGAASGEQSGADANFPRVSLVLKRPLSERVGVFAPDDARTRRPFHEKKTRQEFAELLAKALLRFANNHRQCMIDELSIKAFETASWLLEAFFSAIRASPILIGKVYVSGGNFVNEKKRLRYWKSLADAFLHVRSCMCGTPCMKIHTFGAPNLELTDNALCVINHVLRQKEIRSQKSWRLGQGTEMAFADRNGKVISRPVRLAYDTHVNLAMDDTTSSTSKDVNLEIPAYGICQVPREALIASVGNATNVEGPLTSLTVCFRTDGDGIRDFFHKLGWSLQELSLVFSRGYIDIDVHAVLPTILTACPHLTSLTLRCDCVDLDWFATTYENLGGGEQFPQLTTLKFRRLDDFGEHGGCLLAEHLGDPTTRLAQQLKVLTISSNSWRRPYINQMLGTPWRSLNRNTTLEKLRLVVPDQNFTEQWRQRFHQSTGQVLSPCSLLLERKIGLLSAVWRSKQKYGDSAIQCLDQRALTYIFEFATTRDVTVACIYFHTELGAFFMTVAACIFYREWPQISVFRNPPAFIAARSGSRGINVSDDTIDKVISPFDEPRAVGVDNICTLHQSLQGRKCRQWHSKSGDSSEALTSTDMSTIAAVTENGYRRTRLSNMSFLSDHDGNAVIVSPMQLDMTPEAAEEIKIRGEAFELDSKDDQDDEDPDDPAYTFTGHKWKGGTIPLTTICSDEEDGGIFDYDGGDLVVLTNEGRTQGMITIRVNNPSAVLLIPGYGPCRVFRESLVLSKDKPGASELEDKPLTAPSLGFSDEIPNDDVVSFAEIGWTLQTLSFTFFGSRQHYRRGCCATCIYRCLSGLTESTIRADSIDQDHLGDELRRAGDNCGVNDSAI
ncbi:hypothetical protein ON010_g6711 [Phytophthora cinnamomi]|nr:hypothetical protein ON010_g6711 [Phytophthora cinnamomi]